MEKNTAQKKRVAGGERSLTPDKREELLAAYSPGVTLTSLAEQFGVSRGTVRRLLATQDITAPSRALLNEEQAKDAVRMYQEGLSVARIGRELGTGTCSARTALRNAGIEVKERFGSVSKTNSAEIVKARQNGKSVAEIAEQFGVTSQTVRNHLRKAGA